MKTQSTFFRKWGILPLIILSIMACSKDDAGGDGPDPGPDPTEANTFAEVIALGGDFEDFPQSETVEVQSEDPPENEDYDREEEGEIIQERFVCTRRTVSVTDGNGEFPLFNPNSSIIYPGNMLQGKTLDDATPEAIPLKRAGGTISYNIIDGNLQSSFTVDEVKTSSIRDAQNNIIFGSITDGDYSVPANFSLSVKEVQSKEELALKLGVKFKTFAAKVSGNFSVNTSREVNTVLVKLTQQFYTMDFDVPTSPDGFFDESVTPDQLKTYIQADNPAAFISSVTYGRTFYMLFESTSSASEMKTKLNAGYKTIGASVEGSVEFDSFSSLKNLSLQVIAYGGDAAETLDAVGNFTDNNSIGTFLSNIGKTSDIRTGLPLSYVVNSVERPSRIVGAKLATEYDVVECELKGTLPPGIYKDLVDLFEDGIGAMGRLRGSDVLIFNKAGDKYAWFNGNTPGILSDGDRRIFSISDATAPLGALELENVGAVVKFADNLDDRLYVISGDGFKLQIVRFTNYTQNTLPTGSIGTPGGVQLVNQIFGDSGNFIIGTDGFEAAVGVGVTSMAYFAKPGDRYQIYNSSSGGSWSDPVASDKWFQNQTNDGGTQFDKVGAATNFALGGSSGRFLFVNGEGNEIQEWFSEATENDRFNGPWVIN